MSFFYFNRANQLLRDAYMRRAIAKARRNLRKKKSKLPQYFTPLDENIEKLHRELWSPLYSSIDLNYLRMASHISGKPNYQYVPEDIYNHKVMRIMNDINRSRIDSHKNFLDKHVGTENIAKIYLRKSFGSFYDTEGKAITRTMAKDIFENINRDVISKPATNSSSGKKVIHLRRANNQFVDNAGRTVRLEDLEVRYDSDYIVQEYIIQHPFLAGLNKSSVNSFRVTTYRSVIDEMPHAIQINLKIGKAGEVADNLHLGAVVVLVDKEGTFSPFGLNSHYEKIWKVPQSGNLIENLQMPHFEKIVTLAKEVATKMTAQRILNLDITLNDENKAILIEINCVKSGTIAQLMGNPHFGEHVHEIIDYCTSHKGMDNMRMIRS